MRGGLWYWSAILKVRISMTLIENKCSKNTGGSRCAFSARYDVTGKREKRPPGRPALPPDESQTAMIRERVTPAQRQEYEARGGKVWLVAALNRKRSK